MMSQMRSVALALTLVSLLGFSTGCATQGNAGSRPQENEIWALETEYWVANRDAAHEKIVSLWHDRFLAWPGSELEPIGKEVGLEYVRRSFPAPGSFSFTIEPKGIRVRGDVAVNYYTVRLTARDGEGQEPTRSMRIVHTWIREPAGWKMLGGMSD